MYRLTRTGLFVINNSSNLNFAQVESDQRRMRTINLCMSDLSLILDCIPIELLRCSLLPPINMDGLFTAFSGSCRDFASDCALQVYSSGCLTHCKTGKSVRLRAGVSIFQEYDLILRFVDRSLYWSLFGINWLLASSYNTSSMCGASYLQTD